VKGYSVTLPIGAEHSPPSISITDEERYVVMSRLGDRLRAAGTAEIAGFDERIDRDRANRVLESLMELFPEGGDERRVSYWTGLRPMTPDGLPILGSSPVENLFLNCGHGTLGWTMACGSAQVVADVISGRSPPISLEGLTYDRFGRR
jgi:D-amino-acid dehydrogenase